MQQSPHTRSHSSQQQPSHYELLPCGSEPSSFLMHTAPWLSPVRTYGHTCSRHTTTEKASSPSAAPCILDRSVTTVLKLTRMHKVASRSSQGSSPHACRGSARGRGISLYQTKYLESFVVLICHIIMWRASSDMPLNRICSSGLPALAASMFCGVEKANYVLLRASSVPSLAIQRSWQSRRFWWDANCDDISCFL